ncbi:MAG TPA: hypothetical protein VGF14_01880 [Alphaproteobacteria bacterium]
MTTIRTNGTNTVMYILALVAATIIALAVIMHYTRQEDRSLGGRIEAAADEMAEGVENASEEMQDRTPAEKAGDAIEDFGDRVEKAVE